MGTIQVLDYFQRRDQYATFKYKVTDDIAPGYSNKIKKAMWLDEMRRKNNASEYAEWEDLQDDFDLMFDNCVLYNGAASKYGEFVSICRRWRWHKKNFWRICREFCRGRPGEKSINIS